MAPTDPGAAPEIPYLLQFTAEEKRVVLAKYAEYMQVLQVIADLHGITGAVVIAPDGSGFFRPPDPPPSNPGAQKG